jgi:hypothetical protein
MEKLGMPPYKSRKAAPFGAALMFIFWKLNKPVIYILKMVCYNYKSVFIKTGDNKGENYGKD